MNLRRWKDRMVARLLTRYPGLVKRWSGNRDFSAEMAGFRAGAGFTPWTPPAKPVRECSVALVTTGGVRGKHDGETVKSPPPRGLTALRRGWCGRAADELDERRLLAFQRLHGFSMLVALRLLLTS